jgi:chaperonin GroEL
VAVKEPGFGDRRNAILEDIAASTEERDPSDALGKANRVRNEKENTTIIESAGKDQENEGLIAQINALSENTKSDYDLERLQERLAKLAGVAALRCS